MPPRVRRRFIWCSGFLLAIILIGTIGYWFIGGRQYSLIDSLYMTVITITTIGFTEIVNMSGNPGARIFTMFIAISGIGVLMYVITNIITLIIEGELTEAFRRRRMEKTANSYKDHFIICGLGTVGSYIISELRGAGRPYVIVDSDKDIIEKALLLDPDEIAIEGDATNNDTLINAGIERARGVFCRFRG